ncbi:hypothetical protein B0H16DRAFT_1467199 [Mycena metata]|uniref:Uncharacterized protein n=1 Tax=Mycena metata TaxID=1033252 RepID=A0AAD7I743_9AGAR|nr:hypothetical protein B0H16DRAFT_1467199 [Mycena metata]
MPIDSRTSEEASHRAGRQNRLQEKMFQPRSIILNYFEHTSMRHVQEKTAQIKVYILHCVCVEVQQITFNHGPGYCNLCLGATALHGICSGRNHELTFPGFSEIHKRAIASQPETSHPDCGIVKCQLTGPVSLDSTMPTANSLALSQFKQVYKSAVGVNFNRESLELMK